MNLARQSRNQKKVPQVPQVRSSASSEKIQNQKLSELDRLVKSLLERHPGESRGPEHLEITGSYRNFLFYPPPPTPPTGGGEEFGIGPIPSPLMGEGQGGGDNNLRQLRHLGALKVLCSC